MSQVPGTQPEIPGTEVTHRFVDAGELRMHVAEAGDGPPVVATSGARRTLAVSLSARRATLGPCGSLG